MPSNVTITQFEPVVFMRGGTGRDARGRLRQLNTSVSPSHVRALLTLDLQKACKIRDIQVSFSGLTHTDWPEGIGPNRLENSESTPIFKQIVTIWSAKEDHRNLNRRRCNSIGPGVNGVLGDEDWSTFSTAVASGAGGGGGPSAAEASSSTTASQSYSGSGSTDAGTLARSIAGAAARAGTAIMPATIRNELSSARKANKGSTKDKDRTSPSSARPPLGRQWSSEASASTSRIGGGILPRAFGGSPSASSLARSARPTSASSSQSQSRSQIQTEEDPTTPNARSIHAALSDPPPTYDEAATPPANGERSSYFDSQGSTGTGILHHTPRSAGLRSPAASGVGVRFGSVAADHHGTSTTPTLPPPPLTRMEDESTTTTRRRSTSTDRKASSGSTNSTGGGRKASTALKNLIGGLLLSEKNDDDTSNTDWKLFKPGVYQFPVTIQLPSDLPPTLHADFGHNAYHLRALVRRVGALTSNLMAEREVTLIHSPEDDGTTDATDLIVVQRTWEQALAYMVVISGKTFPIQQRSKIPVWMKLAPIDKVSVHRITASIEEHTSYFAKGRTTARHEVPRRWHLLKLTGPGSGSGSGSGSGEDASQPLLPILSDAPDALDRSPLAVYVPRDVDGQPEEDGLSALLDPSGPWELYLDVPLPTCSATAINLSSAHVKANVQVAHTLRVSLRVSRSGSGVGEGGKDKQFDIIIEAPITLTHSHTAEEWISLPSYWTLAALESGGGGGAGAVGEPGQDGNGGGGGNLPSSSSSFGSGTGMARSASFGERADGASSLTPSTSISAPAPAPLSRPAYVPKVPAPSPVAMRALGLTSSAAAQRNRLALAVGAATSSAVRSGSGSGSGSGVITVGNGSGSGSGFSGAGGLVRSASPAPLSSPTSTGGRDSSPNSNSGTGTDTGTARDLSRQWLALSSVGSSPLVTRGSGAGTGSGTGTDGGAVVVLEARGDGQGEPPPPDYRSVVEAGQS
ncbi:unnamed protein product [Tilletia controversa]|nr:unnamed protein product [Tilletia controversa]CAD6928268.1 unnamed protein product [Tilletia controversa]CAD6934882.1 unnamed protein product [Tilletia controversa]CAD6968409.1 unnamed protein product [Tilletia controversa]CAD6981072.1 unnamed protein product [Tilletia controversa]